MAGRLIPMGGGGFSMEPRNPRLDKWLIGLTQRPRPRVLFVPTASGDSDDYVRRFYRAFEHHNCDPVHLTLFNRTNADVRETILSADLIYVGGGNTANMLAVWRLHGVDAAMREAFNEGRILCGVSAGAICWFEGGVTDSFGPKLQPLRDGLGLLSGSFCPHYDGEVTRRPVFHELVAAGKLPDGYAADDGVAIMFEEGAVADIVRSRKRGAACRLTRTADGATETTLKARLLMR